MFEGKNEPLAPPEVFRGRAVRFFLLSLGLIVVWVTIGGIGFYLLASLPWIDAFYNAAMITSDMGPVFILQTVPAKVFAAIYSLLSGLVFITTTGIALAPIIHRVFHHFHLEKQEPD